MVISQPVPGPEARTHERLTSEALMDLNHPVVNGRILMVIIPIDQTDIGRDRRFDIVRNDRPGIIIILRFAAHPEIHVGPDHRLKAGGPAECADLLQMAVEKIETADPAVPVQVYSPAKVMSFIETDMDPAGTAGAAPESDHLFDQPVSLGFIGKQHTRRIADRPGTGTAQEYSQMPQCLNAPDQFDAEAGGIIIKLPDFGLGIRSAQKAEMRFIRQLISVFRVEHRHIIAGQRQPPQDRFGIRERHDRVAGVVQHHAEQVERAFFSAGGLPRQRQTGSAQGGGKRVIRDRDPVFPVFNVQRIAFPEMQRGAAGAFPERIFFCQCAQGSCDFRIGFRNGPAESIHIGLSPARIYAVTAACVFRG